MDNLDKYNTFIEGKGLERYFNLNNTLFEFQKLFSCEEPNDIAIVIVGGSFLDTLLENILLEFFPDNDKEVDELLSINSPLGTYSSKIRLLYCLGLIEKVVKDDLKLNGKIRNCFAHDLKTNFQNKKIAGWCKELKWHKISFIQNPPDEATSRDFFQVNVNTLISHLSGVVSIARGEKRKIKNN
jgi:DNA-binding MltR family transcriptional regulator